MSVAEAVPLLAHSPIRQLQRAKMTESLQAIVLLTLAEVMEIVAELRLLRKNRHVSWHNLSSRALPFVRILALTRLSARWSLIRARTRREGDDGSPLFTPRVAPTKQAVQLGGYVSCPKRGSVTIKRIMNGRI